jgi:hypothetical protein
VFAVDGHPFFVYGAAFFYERIPRDRWRQSLLAYRVLGINTIDLYVIWNWHQPDASHPPDFTGTTDPRRDLVGLLALVRRLGFYVVLRPGPVIRNEWRNGGYPDWLLERPEYGMPLHDVLEGRYPATATLQNAHADDAAAEWMNNATHLQRSREWLRDVLQAVEPFSHRIIGVALDDDQGAYLDNDTWPAPHWHAYIDWLAQTVRATIGTHVPVFVNTFEMKVTAASPAWAWGDWYQSDAYEIGAHDLGQLDFATGLLQTQPRAPVMYAEFQAGWLQGADEAEPRPSDPANTSLALNELLRDGAHGVVNFPVQDTIYPPGWEAPWANWSYAWDAALTDKLAPSARYAPTAAFGDEVQRYGALLAATHRLADVAIVWPPSLFSSRSVSNHDIAAFADATIAMQRECGARQVTCDVVDLAYAGDATIARYRSLLLPIVLDARLRAMETPAARRQLQQLKRFGRLGNRMPSVSYGNMPDATILLANDGSYAFVDAVNPSTTSRTVGPLQVRLRSGTVRIPPFAVAPRSARLIPAGNLRGVNAPQHSAPPERTGSEPLDRHSVRLDSPAFHVAFSPAAGARVWDLHATGGDNAASSIGLLRDTVDPEPSPSSRDYIAPYTHPLAAGTFNRTYTCAEVHDDTSVMRERCSYDAPDLPAGGGRFERTLSLGADGSSLTVSERLSPSDPAANVRLESISGFAFRSGDELLNPPGASYVAIVHRGYVTVLRWEPNAVQTATVRATRGAQLVTLVFRGLTGALRLEIHAARDAAEARRLLQANRR